MKATSSNPTPFFFVVLLLVPLFVAPPSDAAMTCTDVISDIRPCISYLIYGGLRPSESCCVAVRKLQKDATTTPDIQTACRCLKQFYAVSEAPGGTAEFLPGKCGIYFPYVFAVGYDCTKIKVEPKEVFFQGFTFAEA